MKPLRAILPVNEKPSMVSYAHTTYNNCILTSSAMDSETVVEFEVESARTDWKTLTFGGDIQIGDKVSVTTQSNKTRGYCLMYRPVEKDDSIIIKVTSRRMICAWECIDLVLEAKEPDETYDIEGSMVNLMCPCGRELHIRQNGSLPDLKDHPRMSELPFWLKIEKRDYQVICSYSRNVRRWHEVYSYDLLPRVRIAPLYMGVLVELRNDYKNWLANNFILNAMKREWGDGALFWDYYLSPIKHYKPLFPSQFLDFSYETYPCYRFNGFKMKNLIMNKLLEKKYVFLFLNHYYIENSMAYLKFDYHHEVLIYGIDRVKRCFFGMAYGDKSAVIPFHISFRDFWKAIEKTEIRFFTAKIDVNQQPYYVQPKTISQKLQNYLDGTNYEILNYDVYPTPGSSYFGIKAMEHLLDDRIDLAAFSSSIRLTYFLWEHKKLMLERYQFLSDLFSFSGEREEEIRNALEENLKYAQVIKNMTLINQRTNSKHSSFDKIRDYIERIANNEKKVYPILIEMLNGISEGANE